MLKIRNVLVFTIVTMLICHGFAMAQVSREHPLIFKNNKDKKWRLDGKWKYNWKDSSHFALPNYDDRSWKTSEIGHLKLLEKSSTLWLRYYFKVDSTLLGKPMVLGFLQVGASEIYLNGKKIQSIGTMKGGKISEAKIRNLKPLILSFKNTDVQVISIRLLPQPLEGIKAISINSKRAFHIEFEDANQRISEILETTKNVTFYSLMIFGIFAALGFVHFLLFLFYQKAVYNLYFSLYNLAISILGLSFFWFFNFENLEEAKRYFYIVFIALLVLGFSLTGFVNALFGKSKMRFWILFAISILIFIVSQFKLGPALLLVFLFLVFVAFESLYLIIRAMIRKEKSAFIVGGGILFLFVYIIIVVILTVLDKFNLVNYDAVFGNDIFKYFAILVLISFPISISAYLAWQYAATNLNLKKQLDEVNRLSDITVQQEHEKQQILQNQNQLLEKQVAERTLELQAEKQKSDDLLLNILPQEVAEELKEKGSTEAKFYDEVSVLFTDFVNFTQNAEKLGAEKMLDELNECFTAFDLIMETHGLEKIKTIGDAYLAVCGLPLSSGQHAINAVNAGIEILEFVEKRKKDNPAALDIRIGIHSGPVIAGIVGVKKFAYDIWGDTVNTAARMEQNGEKGKLNVSGSTYALISEHFDCEYRGKIETKGKGALDMYFVKNSI